MAEPFKNMFRPETVAVLADLLAAGGPFDRQSFVESALKGLEELELKDRVRHLAESIRQHLDDDYRTALAHIVRSLPPPMGKVQAVTSSFIIWPLCHFVEAYGVQDPEVSLPALYELTRRFSAEFAIRPFLLGHSERTLELLTVWASDDDPHVRRLVSEGTRPRLPWGIRLGPFVEDPSPILPLLEELRDDSEEYVRRSVANNLNDISKDHPEVVVEVCGRWSKHAGKDLTRLIRHALRSLVKQGHPDALAVLGFKEPSVEIVSFSGPSEATIGSSARLTAGLRSLAETDQKLVVDYVLLSPGARGVNRKVFKWATRTLSAGASMTLGHGHSFRPVTTRRTRVGEYRFVLQINGIEMAEFALELRVRAEITLHSLRTDVP